MYISLEEYINSPMEDWWRDADEIDLRISSTLETEDFWTSGFLPPPPRPPFLEDVSTDGLTTCDLCTWARHPHLANELSDSRELSWVMTLIIVSLLSALIGAVVMITVIRCRNRLKDSTACFCLSRDTEPDTTTVHLRNISTSRASSKELESRYAVPEPGDDRNTVLSWLSRRSTQPPTQLGSIAHTAADNPYIVEEAYHQPNNNVEALYAELDSTSNPAYQNTRYNGSSHDQDCITSSAPSSAYYSDLSCAPSDRTYEAVGPPEPMAWGPLSNHIRLTAISESRTVPDYI